MRKTGINIKAVIVIFAALAVIAIACATLFGQLGTTSKGTSISRSEMYQSVSQLADDSDAIIVGTVESSENVSDIDPSTEFVLATVKVADTKKGNMTPGDTVIVRQTPLSDAQLMSKGATYLLYLTESGLEGELASQYYVTGVTAGIYEKTQTSARSAASFERFDKASGDDLPDMIAASEIEG